MQTLMNQLRLTTARFTPCRAVVVAMLSGPAVGTLLAFGASAALEENLVTIDNFTTIVSSIALNTEVDNTTTTLDIT